MTPSRSGRCSAPTPSTGTTRSPSRSGGGRRSWPTGCGTATRPGPTRAPTARCSSPATRRWPGATAATSTPTGPSATSSTTCSCSGSTPTGAAPSSVSGTCPSPSRRTADVSSLLAGVVSREPLAVADGRSGSLLERVTLAGGEVLVVKHVRDGGDWIMRASHDHGRAAELWSSGVLARVPEVVEHAVLAAEPTGDGWVVIMRDMSAALVPEHARLRREDSRRVLEAAAALHAAFWDEPPLDLCPMVDRYQFLSPATARREAGGADEVPKLIGRGWERFAELVPDEVAGPALSILERPEPFAAALSARPSTLVHGDL